MQFIDPSMVVCLCFCVNVRDSVAIVRVVVPMMMVITRRSSLKSIQTHPAGINNSSSDTVQYLRLA